LRLQGYATPDTHLMSSMPMTIGDGLLRIDTYDPVDPMGLSLRARAIVLLSPRFSSRSCGLR
jgi:hypothetical protein